MHGDRVPRDQFEAQLYGDGAARVETVYNQRALDEYYLSEIAEPVPEPWWVVNRVRGYAAGGRIGREGMDR